MCYDNERKDDIFLKLKSKFPFLDICVWSPRVLASYMLHVTNIAYSFVNVEKDEMEAVFHALQDMRLGRNRFGHDRKSSLIIPHLAL